MSPKHSIRQATVSDIDFFFKNSDYDLAPK